VAGRGGTSRSAHPERATCEARHRDGRPADEETWPELLDAAQSIGIARERIEGVAGLARAA
jgi:hypothetical protein